MGPFLVKNREILLQSEQVEKEEKKMMQAIKNPTLASYFEHINKKRQPIYFFLRKTLVREG